MFAFLTLVFVWISLCSSVVTTPGLSWSQWDESDVCSFIWWQNNVLPVFVKCVVNNKWMSGGDSIPSRVTFPAGLLWCLCCFHWTPWRLPALHFPMHHREQAVCVTNNSIKSKFIICLMGWWRRRRRRKGSRDRRGQSVFSVRKMCPNLK